MSSVYAAASVSALYAAAAASESAAVYMWLYVLTNFQPPSSKQGSVLGPAFFFWCGLLCSPSPLLRAHLRGAFNFGCLALAESEPDSEWQSRALGCRLCLPARPADAPAVPLAFARRWHGRQEKRYPPRASGRPVPRRPAVPAALLVGPQFRRAKMVAAGRLPF